MHCAYLLRCQTERECCSFNSAGTETQIIIPFAIHPVMLHTLRNKNCVLMNCCDAQVCHSIASISCLIFCRRFLELFSIYVAAFWPPQFHPFHPTHFQSRTHTLSVSVFLLFRATVSSPLPLLADVHDEGKKKQHNIQAFVDLWIAGVFFCICRCVQAHRRQQTK